MNAHRKLENLGRKHLTTGNSRDAYSLGQAKLDVLAIADELIRSAGSLAGLLDGMPRRRSGIGKIKASN